MAKSNNRVPDLPDGRPGTDNHPDGAQPPEPKTFTCFVSIPEIGSLTPETITVEAADEAEAAGHARREYMARKGLFELPRQPAITFTTPDPTPAE